MSDLQRYAGNQFIRWMCGQAFPAPPANLWVGLFNGQPSASGVEVTTEVVPTGRKALTLTAPPDDGLTNTTSNSADTNFGSSANAVPNIDYLGFFDAAAGGNLVWEKPVTPTSVQAGAVVKILAGALSVTVGNPGA